MIPVDGEEGPADVCVIELGGTIGKKPPRLLKKGESEQFVSWNLAL